MGSSRKPFGDLSVTDERIEASVAAFLFSNSIFFSRLMWRRNPS